MGLQIYENFNLIKLYAVMVNWKEEKKS
jgi:hypothetical protein